MTAFGENCKPKGIGRRPPELPDAPRPTAIGPISVRIYGTRSCHDALDALMSAIAAELLDRLTREMQSLIKEWQGYKRAAALLDFDDLLYTARDLLAGHEEIRQAAELNDINTCSSMNFKIPIPSRLIFCGASVVKLRRKPSTSRSHGLYARDAVSGGRSQAGDLPLSWRRRERLYRSTRCDRQ